MDALPFTPARLRQSPCRGPFASRWSSRSSVGRRGRSRRAREVRVAGGLAVAGEEVEEDDVVGGDRPDRRPDHRGLRAVRDDELLAAAPCSPNARSTSSLTRSQVSGRREREHAVERSRRSSAARRRRPSPPRRRAGAANPGELGPVLDRRRSSKKRWSAVSSIPFARRWSASASGKPAGVTAAASPSVRQALRTSSRSSSVGVEPSLQQLVDTRVLERENLEVGAELADPAGLERADDDAPLPADLGVEERVGDRSGTSCLSSGERTVSATIRTSGIGRDPIGRFRSRETGLWPT